MHVITDIFRNQWILWHIVIVGWRSNGWSSDATFQIKSRGLTSTLDRWSYGSDLIATIRSTDASWKPLIAMHLFIERSRPNPPFKYSVLRDGRIGPWIFEKFELSRHQFKCQFSFFVFLMHFCIQGVLEIGFWSREEGEITSWTSISSSKTRNEKPCIRRLIGSFRRLLWVRLHVFVLILHHLVLILHFE